jgi:hypothetical protein
VPLAEIQEGDTIKIRSPDSGSPSPGQPRVQRASFTSTQTARERPPKRTASTTATKVRAPIPGSSGASSITR